MKRFIPTHIPEWFALPKFNDPDQARTAYLLNTILYVMLAIIGGYGLLAAVKGSEVGAVAALFTVIVILTTMFIIRRGHVQTAGLLFAAALWVIQTATAMYFGGLQGAAYMMLMLMMLVLGTLFSTRLRLLLTILMVLSSVMLFLIETHGLLPVKFVPSEFDFSLRLLMFLVAALLLHLIARSLSAALARVRSSEQALKSAVADLVNTTISKTYLDNILRSINDSLIVLGPDMRIERVNQATLDLLDYAESDLLGQTPEPIFPPDALDWLMRTVQDSPVKTIETTFRTRTGAEIPVSFSASRLLDTKGQVQGVVCVAQDITERQQAAQEMRKREELYRTLGRNLPDMGVVLYDSDLRIIIAEGSALTKSGYPSEKSEGRLLLDLLPAAAAEKLEPIYRAAFSGQHFTTDYVSPISHRIYSVQALPVRNETGDIFAGMVLFEDVTAKRKADMELRQHIEQLTILRRVDVELNRKLDVPYVLKLALDLAVRVSMAQAGAILLLDDDLSLQLEQVIGDFSDNVLSDYFKWSDGPLKQALDSGQPQPVSETTVLVPMLSPKRSMGVLLLETLHPLTTDELNFMQVLAARVASALDNARLYEVSRKQYAELQELYNRVSELEQLKTDMIRIAAHDLRNPINVVSGFAELMLDNGSLPQREHEQIQHMYQAARRMQKMVGDILSLERITQIQAGAARETFDLAELVSQIYQAHRPSAQEHDFQLDAPDKRVLVDGDVPQIREAVVNLVTNALKYTPAGGKITMQLHTTRTHVKFEVVDTGYGIPEDMQARLFQPFFRARSQKTRHIEGTGLGLHLVKNIIERHNGRLYVHSVYGEGSTFGFELPLTSQVTAEPAYESAAQPRPD